MEMSNIAYMEWPLNPTVHSSYVFWHY